MCAGQVVTIDLNDPDAPSPNRSESDVVLGTPAGDIINAGGGTDIICAGGGIDTVTPGGGAPAGMQEQAYGGEGQDFFYSYSSGSDGEELFDGGSGFDSVDYDSCCEADGVTVDLMLTGPQHTGGGGIDELVDVEALEGSFGDDVLSGNAAGNSLEGSLGDDVLIGRDGNDYLLGDYGNDTISGGAGDDDLQGENSSDTIYGGSGDDEISLGNPGTRTPAERGYGGAGNDHFQGSESDELLVGRSGRDGVRYGVICPACQEGNPGSFHAVRVDLRLSGPQDTWDGGTDELSGIEALIGTGEDDVLLGDGESNSLSGEGGADTLIGRRGADDLQGGPGREDRCIGGRGRDHIEACEN